MITKEQVATVENYARAALQEMKEKENRYKQLPWYKKVLVRLSIKNSW